MNTLDDQSFLKDDTGAETEMISDLRNTAKLTSIVQITLFVSAGLMVLGALITYVKVNKQVRLYNLDASPLYRNLLFYIILTIIVGGIGYTLMNLTNSIKAYIASPQEETIDNFAYKFQAFWSFTGIVTVIFAFCVIVLTLMAYSATPVEDEFRF